MGARVAATPRAAAEAQDVVLAMVRDDAASAEVCWGRKGRWMHCLRTRSGSNVLSLPGLRALGAAFAAAGRAFVDVPLAGSRPQAEAGSLIFLAGGAAADVERLRPVLLAMGGAVHHTGPVGTGCLAKLYVNGLFGAQLALTGEFIGLIRRAGFDPAPLIAACAGTPVAAPALSWPHRRC